MLIYALSINISVESYPIVTMKGDTTSVTPRGFLLILLFQVLFLVFSILLTCLWTNAERVLVVADALYHTQGLMSWGIVAFVSTSVCLRLSLHLYPRILLILSLLFHTVAGTVIACHLSSLILCNNFSHLYYGEGGGDDIDIDGCNTASPSTVRGQNAVYISVPLLLFSFVAVHMINVHRPHNTEAQSVNVSIIVSTIFILFVECGSVCIIDDTIWDWKYAYACLFTVGFTVYLNGVSTYVLFTQRSEESDKWERAALVYLQPLLLMEDSVKACLTL
jgi:hypothetical protein